MSRMSRMSRALYGWFYLADLWKFYGNIRFWPDLFGLNEISFYPSLNRSFAYFQDSSGLLYIDLLFFLLRHLLSPYFCSWCKTQQSDHSGIPAMLFRFRNDAHRSSGGLFPFHLCAKRAVFHGLPSASIDALNRNEIQISLAVRWFCIRENHIAFSFLPLWVDPTPISQGKQKSLR